METTIKKDQIIPLCETRFLSLYDLQYAAGKHYFNVSRRNAENLMFRKSTEEFKNATADAATIVTVLHIKDREPLLVLSYEYRYPAGQFLLSPPAGLIDPEDGVGEDALITASKRELFEELGITFTEKDSLAIINPLLFSSPGMTDESNALMLAEIYRDELPQLKQDGAVGTELFDGYVLLTAEDAGRILKQGKDDKGIFYSVYTWAALHYFVSL